MTNGENGRQENRGKNNGYADDVTMDETPFFQTPKYSSNQTLSRLILSNLTQLPDELIMQIFRLLSFSERASLERVNKRLNDLLVRVWMNQTSFAVRFGSSDDSSASGIKLIDHLDFVNFDQVVSVLIKTPNLVKVSFVGLPVQVIEFIASNCKLIEEIYTDNLSLVQKYVNGVGVPNRIRKVALTEFAESRCLSVTNLDFLVYACPALKEIHLGQFSNVYIPVSIIKRLVALTTTESSAANSTVEILSEGSSLKKLTCFHGLTEPEIRLMNRCIPKVEKISAGMDARDLVALIPFKCLKSLSVQLIQGTRAAPEVSIFIQNVGRQLEKLEIIQCPSKGRDPEFYHQLPDACPNLRHLTLDTLLVKVDHFKALKKLKTITLQESGIENLNLLNVVLSSSRKMKRVRFRYMKEEGHHTSTYGQMPSQEIIHLLQEYGLNRRNGYCFIEIDGKPWNGCLPQKTLDYIFST